MQGRLNSRGACAEPVSAGGTKGGKMPRPANGRGGSEAEQNTDRQMETDREGSADHDKSAMSFLEGNQDEQKGQGVRVDGVCRGREERAARAANATTSREASRHTFVSRRLEATERPMVRSGSEVYGLPVQKATKPKGGVGSEFVSVASVAHSPRTHGQIFAGHAARLHTGGRLETMRARLGTPWLDSSTSMYLRR